MNINPIFNADSNKISQPNSETPGKVESTLLVDQAVQVFEVTSNLFDAPPLEGNPLTFSIADSDKSVGILQNAAPELTGTVIESATTDVMKKYPAMASMSKFAPKIISSAVKTVITQQMQPTEQEVNKLVVKQVNENIKQETQKLEVELDGHLDQVSKLSVDQNKYLDEASQRLKDLCSGSVPAKEAFPLQVMRQLFQGVKSLMGYEIPKEFGQKEYEEWCQTTDKAIADLKKQKEQSVETYKDKKKLDFEKQKEGLMASTMDTVSDSPLTLHPTVEVTKEFARGAGIGILEILANAAVLKNIKGPMPLILSMVGLNAILSAAEVATHSSGRIVELTHTEGKLEIAQNRSLEFMKRLVNSVGVSGLVTIVTLVSPAGMTLNLFRMGIATALASGVAEVLNPVSSTDPELKGKMEAMSKELTSYFPSLFTEGESGANINEVDADVLRELAKSVPNDKLVAILQEEINKLYPVQKETIEEKSVEEQSAIEQKNLTKEMQEQVILLVIACLIVSIFYYAQGGKQKSPAAEQTPSSPSSFQTTEPITSSSSPTLVKDAELALNQNTLQQRKKGVVKQFEADIASIVNDSDLDLLLSIQDPSFIEGQLKAISSKRGQIVALSESINRSNLPKNALARIDHTTRLAYENLHLKKQEIKLRRKDRQSAPRQPRVRRVEQTASSSGGLTAWLWSSLTPQRWSGLWNGLTEDIKRDQQTLDTRSNHYFSQASKSGQQTQAKGPRIVKQVKMPRAQSERPKVNVRMPTHPNPASYASLLKKIVR